MGIVIPFPKAKAQQKAAAAFLDRDPGEWIQIAEDAWYATGQVPSDVISAIEQYADWYQRHADADDSETCAVRVAKAERDLNRIITQLASDPFDMRKRIDEAIASDKIIPVLFEPHHFKKAAMIERSKDILLRAAHLKSALDRKGAQVQLAVSAQQLREKAEGFRKGELIRHNKYGKSRGVRVPASNSTPNAEQER